MLPRGDRPKPRLVLRCVRVADNAADDCSARVPELHIVVVLVPMIRTTAFACRYKNKLCVIDLRMCHREHGSLPALSDFLIFNHAFDGPDLYGELSFFETMPSRPSLQTASNIRSP